MTIPFKNIPSSLRVPLFYAEIDPSHANTSGPNQRALIIGQKTTAGAGVVNVPVLSLGAADAKTVGGPGSMLALMVDAYRKNDPFGEVWTVPVADAGGGVAASGTLVITGPATAAGALALYIAGQRVVIAIASGTAANAIAALINTAINAATDLPVTSTVSTNTVTVTARNAGLCGNDIDMRLNYLGAAGGEVTPAGVGVTITALASGATNPTLTTALANLGDQPFDFIVCPYTDATSLAALTAFLNDTAGRWSWQSKIYGHYFTAFRGTLGASTTFTTTLNDQHSSTIPYNDSPTPPMIWAAALAAQAAISVRADPATPIRSVFLQGVLAPPIQSRFTLAQRDTLLHDGGSTFRVDQSGNVILEKLITTYQTNSFGQPDNSYLDAETMFTLMAVLRRLETDVTTQFARYKLAADGTKFGPGANVVTPAIIRATMIAEYRQMVDLAWVQQADAFAAGLIVQQDTGNPNRVNVLWDGVLIDRLDVLALLAQFRLS